jgi:phosphoglycerol transferase MdoB-like AlkP superfamily enzyme
MRSYLMGTGFERLVWQNDYTLEEQTTSQWGVRDDITFNKLYDMITSQKSPFLIGFSTLSTHEPWDVPTKKLDDEIENAFAYLDGCIGQLIDRLKKTPQWNDLLIVLLPDHSIDHKGMHELLKDRNRIPMVWLGGAVKEPRQVGQICNQTDLPATLLGQMGIAHDDFRFSRDVLSRNHRHPFAIHTFNNAISMVDSTGFAVYDLDSHKTIVAESPEAEKMVRRGMAILQLATDDIKSK